MTAFINIASDSTRSMDELSDLPSSTMMVAPSEDESKPAALHRDEQRLATLGKEQQFKRNFGFVSVVGVSCTLMLTWEGVLATLQYSIVNGGPTGAICQYVYVVFGVFLQTLVMAEMASMIPLSGGQYNWVAILAPRSYASPLSYIVGWLTTVAYQSACCGVVWLNSKIVEALILLNDPTYHVKPWHSVLVCYAIIAFALLMNTYLGKVFPKFEAAALIFHVVGFFVFLVVLLYISDKAEPSEVWQSFHNLSGFAYGPAFLQGTSIWMYAFLGNDTPAHLAEEVQNASRTLPKSMITSILINGALGFSMLITYLFCMGPVWKTYRLIEDGVPMPFLQIIGENTASVGGSTAMGSILLTITVSASTGLLAASSRTLWAFAREQGVPFSRQLAYIEPHTSLPIPAIVLTASISMVFVLLNLFSTATFTALTGITISCFYTVFMISACCLLYKRLVTDRKIPDFDDRLKGDFTLGKLGIPLTLLAITYTAIGWFFCFWPSVGGSIQITAQNFNWSSVVYAWILLLASGYWAVRGRKKYTPPILEWATRAR